MTDAFPPRPIGTDAKPVTLTGKLIPWTDDDQPVLFQMPMCDDYFLSLFSTEEHLRAVLAQVGAPFVRIKQVDDGPTFLDSLPLVRGAVFLRVIVDPRFTDDGRVRFVEIQRGGELT